ncbi:MAG: hypothetical protein IJM30_08810 [Thermoguttaceae bacterium]|nr:hypothetical protein [Thermoguttaceae bacterium]
MKQLNLFLLATLVVGFALVAEQHASADCGKMYVYYRTWPTPPPPPPRPYYYVSPYYPRPVRPNYDWQNGSANSTYQRAGRDAINQTVVNNVNNYGGNVRIDAPKPYRPKNYTEDAQYQQQYQQQQQTSDQWYNQNQNYNQTQNQNVDNSSRVNANSQAFANSFNNNNMAFDDGFSMGADDAFNEPDQQGVLAWNGKTDASGEEILILSTNEQTTGGQSAAMISIFPLPGEPIAIERANAQSFVAAKALLQEKLPSSASGEEGSMGVVYDTKIGSHNIFVWEIESTDDFQGKVQSYVAAKYDGQAAAAITPNTIKVIEKYIGEGFRYFAFDLTQVGEEMATKEAIMYRFKSTYAYFPLRISQVGGVGETKVDLVVLTPCEKLAFTERSSIQKDTTGLSMFGPVKFEKDDLVKIDPAIADLLKDGALARSTVFRSEKIDSFENDFEAIPAE